MLKDYLDFKSILKVGRWAGGHEEIMNVLFKDAKVIEYYIENNYSGSEVFIYLLNGEYILVTDYFGSCSGCDMYEDATDEEIRNLVIQLANNAHRFNTIHELINFLENDVQNDKASYYAEYSTCKVILEKLKKNININREININKIIK